MNSIHRGLFKVYFNTNKIILYANLSCTSFQINAFLSFFIIAHIFYDKVISLVIQHFFCLQIYLLFLDFYY